MLVATRRHIGKTLFKLYRTGDVYQILFSNPVDGLKLKHLGFIAKEDVGRVKYCIYLNIGDGEKRPVYVETEEELVNWFTNSRLAGMDLRAALQATLAGRK